MGLLADRDLADEEQRLIAGLSAAIIGPHKRFVVFRCCFQRPARFGKVEKSEKPRGAAERVRLAPNCFASVRRVGPGLKTRSRVRREQVEQLQCAFDTERTA